MHYVILWWIIYTS